MSTDEWGDVTGDNDLLGMELPDDVTDDNEAHGRPEVEEVNDKDLHDGPEVEEVNGKDLQDPPAVEEVVQNKDKDANISQIHTIRDYHKIFRSAPKYGLSKVWGTTDPAISFVRPRVRLPATGKPLIFVAEGLQANKYNSLICPGRCFYHLQSEMFVTIGVIWVSYVMHNHNNNTYTPMDAHRLARDPMVQRIHRGTLH